MRLGGSCRPGWVTIVLTEHVFDTEGRRGRSGPTSGGGREQLVRVDEDTWAAGDSATGMMGRSRGNGEFPGLDPPHAADYALPDRSIEVAAISREASCGKLIRRYCKFITSEAKMKGKDIDDNHDRSGNANRDHCVGDCVGHSSLPRHFERIDLPACVAGETGPIRCLGLGARCREMLVRVGWDEVSRQDRLLVRV